MFQPVSPIQNYILSTLKNANVLRYSELQPENTPNDLFNYHLQFLVKKELVDKKVKGYKLSEKGIKYVADPIVNKSEVNNLFKFNVLTIVYRKRNGKIEVLNQRRKSNPSYGKIGIMGGVVKKGESIESAATRKLKTETGLRAKNFKVAGIERRMMYVKNELFSDVFFPIAHTNKYEGESVNTEFGENVWVTIDEAIKNDSKKFDSIVKIVDVLKAIKSGKINKLPYFYSENVQTGEF